MNAWPVADNGSDNYEDFIMNPGEDGDGLGSIYDWNLRDALSNALPSVSGVSWVGDGVLMSELGLLFKSTSMAHHDLTTSDEVLGVVV